jgi:hypothetical protein
VEGTRARVSYQVTREEFALHPLNIEIKEPRFETLFLFLNFGGVGFGRVARVGCICEGRDGTAFG